MNRVSSLSPIQLLEGGVWTGYFGFHLHRLYQSYSSPKIAPQELRAPKSLVDYFVVPLSRCISSASAVVGWMSGVGVVALGVLSPTVRAVGYFAGSISSFTLLTAHFCDLVENKNENRSFWALVSKIAIVALYCFSTSWGVLHGSIALGLRVADLSEFSIYFSYSSLALLVASYVALSWDPQREPLRA